MKTFSLTVLIIGLAQVGGCVVNKGHTGLGGLLIVSVLTLAWFAVICGHYGKRRL